MVTHMKKVVKYTNRNPSGDVKIPVEVGDQLTIEIVGGEKVEYVRLDFVVKTSYEHKHKKGCKTVKETREHFQPHRPLMVARMFTHYYPVFRVPGQKGPAMVELKGKNKSIVIDVAGTVDFPELAVPDPGTMYLPGDARGAKLTEADQKYIEDAKAAKPGPQHRFAGIIPDPVVPKPGSLSFTVHVTIIRK
jgi:hypothetical protein